MQFGWDDEYKFTAFIQNGFQAIGESNFNLRQLETILLNIWSQNDRTVTIKEKRGLDTIDKGYEASFLTQEPFLCNQANKYFSLPHRFVRKLDAGMQHSCTLHFDKIPRLATLTKLSVLVTQSLFWETV